MTTQEIINNAITELTENALSVRRGNLPENEVDKHKQLYNQVEKIFERLSSEEIQTIEDYIDESLLSDRDECIFLYIQGAKECIKLLKELGVL